MDVLIYLSDQWSAFFANEGISKLFSILLTPMRKLLTDWAGSIVTGSTLIDNFISELGIAISYFLPANYSVFTIMFGLGVGFFVVYTIAKWVVGILG